MDTTTSVNLQEIKETAENYYRNGEFFCSEAIVKTIRDAFRPGLPDEIIALASGFPVGMGGSGCTCGAVVGGIMALGMVFGRTQAKDAKVQKSMALAHELHDFFQNNHKVLCCRTLTHGMTLGSPVHMQQCIQFTGEVAQETARIIARELGIKTEKEPVSAGA